jgi:peroxiredoxin
MNRFSRTVVILTVCVFNSFSAWPAGAEVRPGTTAPDFALPATDGKTYHLSDFQGKYVVLEWYNKSCPFIRKHYDSGNMQGLQKTYTQKGVAWLEIASSAPGKEGYMTPQDALSQRIKEKMNSTATLLDPDGKVGRLYGAKTTPHMFVINPKGTLIYAGAIDDHNSAEAEDIPKSRNYVADALDAAMAGKPVTTATTQPYGCSIKYK